MKNRIILFICLFLATIITTNAQVTSIAEGFEGTSGSALPAGWGCNFYTDPGLNSAGSQDGFQNSGARSAFLFPKTSVPAETGYLVTPLIAAGTFTFSFWVKQISGASETYSVGICDDQSGLNFTTTNVTPASFSGSTSYTKVTFTISFATNKYIAISTGVGNINTLAIDDITMAETPLPVELLEFNVFDNNLNAELSWSTASETNNYGFDIEKSTDLRIWNKIGFVAGAGNSNQILKYYYNDLISENIKNNNPVIYYRLKQVDLNGSYKYSDTRSVNLNSANLDILVIFTLYPNPASQYLNIISDQPMQQFEIKVYNQNGSLVSNYIMEGSIQLDISKLIPAAYYITITDKVNTKQYQYQYQYKFVKIPD